MERVARLLEAGASTVIRDAKWFCALHYAAQVLPFTQSGPGIFGQMLDKFQRWRQLSSQVVLN